MRTLIGIGLGLVFSCGVTVAAQPPDAKKLIGEWEQPADKAKKRVKAVLECHDATKATLSLNDDNNMIYTMTYKVEGKQLTFNTRSKEGDNFRTFTITNLTDEVFDATEDNGTKFNFTRVKEEPKKDK